MIEMDEVGERQTSVLLSNISKLKTIEKITPQRLRKKQENSTLTLEEGIEKTRG